MRKNKTQETNWYESEEPEYRGSHAKSSETNEAAVKTEADAAEMQPRRNYGSRKMLKGAAGRAELDAERADAELTRSAAEDSASDQSGIADVLEEIKAKQRDLHAEAAAAEPSSLEPDAELRESSPNHRAPRTDEDVPTRRKKRRPHTESALSDTDQHSEHPKKAKGKKKKKRKGYTVGDVLKFFVPWRGDTVLEGLRKIIFSTAVVVVGVCTFLISSYYIDLYQAKQEYGDMQERLEATRNNRGFSENSYVEDPTTGEVIEYLEYNEIADLFLDSNPDLVGYIKINGTKVSYPVVQKKSKDININMNDYYLYRTFHQESSKSGCIFMDYRCHFDEVADHRRVVDNSDNLLIYGHNMNNLTMFGSLREYYRNPGFYMQHPIVELSSIYKSYKFKIFAILVVDGEDFESEYAFDCWNALDFADEDEFYEFVNNAKKRTTVNTNVDVKYGDQILTLYTCHGLHANAKLIIMCRQVRDGEDLYEGTENATLNTNVLYTQQYYYNHAVEFDPDLFVPYGPEA